MKLPLILSFLLCFFVVMVSTAKISHEKNQNIDVAIDKLDDEPLSRRAVSVTSGSSTLTKKTSKLPSEARYRGRCTNHGGYCGSYALPCCGSLSCVSFRCTWSLPSCVGLNTRCGWGGTKCCGTLQCIHGVCKVPKPSPTPSPSPRPTCSRSRCGTGHQRCCSGLYCISGICKGCVSKHEECGHGHPPCCGGASCRHGWCFSHSGPGIPFIAPP